MYPPDNEGRISGENQSLSAQTPFDARRGVVSHPVLEWTDAILNSLETVPQLRSRVVDMFSGLPDAVNRRIEFRDIRAIEEYAESHEWIKIEPLLTETAKKALSLPDSMAKRELIGFAQIVHTSTRAAAKKLNELSSMRIWVDTPEYTARLEFAKDFEDSEDWLEALANVVWIEGKQIEAESKKQASADGVSYLSQLPSVAIENLKEVYRGIVAKVRPKAQKVSVFREEWVNYDDDTVYIKDSGIKRLAICETASEREKSVKEYLKTYNTLINSSKRTPARDIAWLNVAYICIHPHTDFNGTMTRILVDNYITRKGLKRLDWSKIRKDPQVLNDLNNGLLDYAYAGETQPLIDWFAKQIGNTDLANSAAGK